MPGSEWTLDSRALVLFTSGTTGNPKGVVLSHRALLARLMLNRAAIGDATLRRTLVTLPMHFGHGLIGNALTPLAAGGTIVLTNAGISLAASLGALIDEQSITFMTSVPAFWRMGLKLSRRPERSSLRRVHVGSAPLSAELWSRIAAWCSCDVYNCYGMTETSNWFSGASSVDGCEDNLVGRPWGGRAAVIAADGRMASTGEGEIAVLTPAAMSGYFRRPDLTADRLANGWYRTGDTGSIDAAGRIVLSGRVKDEINRGGAKVQPADVELAIGAHPDVEEACAFALPDPASGELVAIAIRLKPGAAANSTLLRTWCAERLRREAVPERWFFVAEIPQTTSGKVNRDQVRRAVTETA